MTKEEAEQIISDINAIKKKTLVSIWNCMTNENEVLADYYSDNEFNKALNRAAEIIRRYQENEYAMQGLPKQSSWLPWDLRKIFRGKREKR